MSDLISKHFPFPNFNPGQREAIESVVAAIEAGKKHIIVEAPTGIGKSAIATTVHRVLREKRKGFRSTIVTATKGLQDQYEGEDKEIFSLKGKINYSCPLSSGPYQSAACKKHVASHNCMPQMLCPYVKKRTEWCDVAPLRMTNTAFQIQANENLVMQSQNVSDLIIIDECHTLEDQLISHSIVSVVMKEMESVEKSCGVDFVRNFIDFINLFLDMEVGTPFVADAEMSGAAFGLVRILEAKIKDLEDKIKTSTNHKEAIYFAVEELKRFAEEFASFGSAKGEWILSKFGYSSELELTPVHASQVSEYAMFRKAKYFLHMSATICGFDSYMADLGIDPEKSVCISVENPIPVENRTVMNLDFMKVAKDYDKHRLAGIIDRIIERHGKENGIIHTVSFQLAEDIKAHSKYSKRMLVSNNRFDIVEELSKHNSGRIIVSPSIEQGYDFKGDMSRWQIVAKVPWAFLGDHRVKLNLARNPDWYARKAVLRLVQACGRSVRGITDHAKTYVIDSTFTGLLSRNKKLFPKWFVESVRTR